MNYYIQGDAAKADQIKAAFEKKGFICTLPNCVFDNEKLIFLTSNGVVYSFYIYQTLYDIIKTHPDYKELELPVQAKFKVGDWYLCVKDFYGKGVRFDKGNTYHCGKDGCLQQFDSGAHISIVEELYEYFRPWTIQDAKDGDVLVTTKIRSCPFIYRKTSYKNNLAYYYVGIDGNGDLSHAYSKNTLRHFGPVADVAPATKEQRDLLFKKMREAGYEWDEEKKELRKIKPHYDIANFKPKQWVLTRDTSEWDWELTMFAYLNSGGGSKFTCINGVTFKQCIPFEGNEHLLGTTDMPSEEYINW